MKRRMTFSEAMRTRAEDVKRRRYTVVPSSWDPYTWESSNAMTFMEAMRTRADDVSRRRFSGVGWGDLPHEVIQLIMRVRRRIMYAADDLKRYWRTRQMVAEAWGNIVDDDGTTYARRYGPGF